MVGDDFRFGAQRGRFCLADNLQKDNTAIAEPHSVLQDDVRVSSSNSCVGPKVS